MGVALPKWLACMRCKPGVWGSNLPVCLQVRGKETFWVFSVKAHAQDFRCGRPNVAPKMFSYVNAKSVNNLVQSFGCEPCCCEGFLLSLLRIRWITAWWATRGWRLWQVDTNKLVGQSSISKKCLSVYCDRKLVAWPWNSSDRVSVPIFSDTTLFWFKSKVLSLSAVIGFVFMVSPVNCC